MNDCKWLSDQFSHICCCGDNRIHCADACPFYTEPSKEECRFYEEEEIDLRKITLEDLKLILDNHLHWLREDVDGWQSMKADLSYANLHGADLRDADIGGAALKQEIANSKIQCLVKKGWVAKYSMPLIECPDCHIGFIPPEELRISMLNYCPNCGRKMDGGEAE